MKIILLIVLIICSSCRMVITVSNGPMSAATSDQVATKELRVSDNEVGHEVTP